MQFIGACAESSDISQVDEISHGIVNNNNKKIIIAVS